MPLAPRTHFTHLDTTAHCSPGIPLVSRGTPRGRSSLPVRSKCAAWCGSLSRSSASSSTRIPTVTSWHPRRFSPRASWGALRRALGERLWKASGERKTNCVILSKSAGKNFVSSLLRSFWEVWNIPLVLQHTGRVSEGVCGEIEPGLDHQQHPQVDVKGQQSICSSWRLIFFFLKYETAKKMAI